VLALEVPGALEESGSSTPLYNVWIRVLPDQPCGGPCDKFTLHPHRPETVAIKSAKCSRGMLTVTAESDFARNRYPTIMTISVDGSDAGTKLEVDPFVLEAPMTWDSRNKVFKYEVSTSVSLEGRRVVVQSDHGGACTMKIQQTFPSPTRTRPRGPRAAGFLFRGIERYLPGASRSSGTTTSVTRRG
jgi:hypothetical protein